MATAAGGGGGDGCGARNSKPMSMPERARRAWVPQPEPGLNCPRCDSTNTKFCYFNNYSLTQPLHYSRACRCYWTHGGVLRSVPVGSGYRRRHTKRSAKPRATSADTADVTRTSRTPNITARPTGTTTVPSGLQYLPMFSSGPLFADCFDPESLGLNFPDRHHHHHHGNWNGKEQWVAAQMNNFPFLQAMDHQMFEPTAAAMPTTMPTTMVAMHEMFHLGLPSGGNGEEDGGHHQFHHHAMLPAKGDHQQQQQDYPSSRGMHGDIVNAGGGYNFYSSTSNADGN